MVVLAGDDGVSDGRWSPLGASYADQSPATQAGAEGIVSVAYFLDSMCAVIIGSNLLYL